MAYLTRSHNKRMKSKDGTIVDYKVVMKSMFVLDSEKVRAAGAT